MGFDIIQIVQGYIAPDLKAIKCELAEVQKKCDLQREENKELVSKINFLSERLSRMEGGIGSLEPTLKTHLENLVLRKMPRSRMSLNQ